MNRFWSSRRTVSVASMARVVSRCMAMLRLMWSTTAELNACWRSKSGATIVQA